MSRTLRGWILVGLLAAVPLAGCTDGEQPGAGRTPTPAGPARVEAPWWNVGESWTLRIEKGSSIFTTTLVNFANGSWDPDHFWLGVKDRDEAMAHVFFETNPFLGRIHWVILAPHEKGMHSLMYNWPLFDGKTWTGSLLGYSWRGVTATARADGGFDITGVGDPDARIAYDYDPETRWFSTLHISEGGKTVLKAEVTDHEDAGAKGTYYFLRGRDYLDTDGGRTGEEVPFTVKDEGATSIAFLMDVTTTGPSRLEFVDPTGRVVHEETLPLGGTAGGEIVEIPEAPTPGNWKLRFVGDVQGEIHVRGIVEYKATL